MTDRNWKVRRNTNLGRLFKESLVYLKGPIRKEGKRLSQGGTWGHVAKITKKKKVGTWQRIRGTRGVIEC